VTGFKVVARQASDGEQAGPKEELLRKRGRGVKGRRVGAGRVHFQGGLGMQAQREQTRLQQQQLELQGGPEEECYNQGSQQLQLGECLPHWQPLHNLRQLASAVFSCKEGDVWLDLEAGKSRLIVVMDRSELDAGTHIVQQEYEVQHPVSKGLMDCLSSKNDKMKSLRQRR